MALHISKQRLQDLCDSIAKEYYTSLCSLDEKADDFSKQFIEIQEYYGAELDNIASAILGEPPVESINMYITYEDEITEDVDYSLHQYVLDNTDMLIRRGLVKTFDRPVYCLLCDRLIKGIGLMDFVDCGTNAVCSDCIDYEHHYIGGGSYFTKFS